MPVDQLQTGRLAPVKASACAQGYGGGSAVGGGQTGGDQFTSDEPSCKQQGQDAAYGGDQTNLDAGADTNFGVSASQCYLSFQPAVFGGGEALKCCRVLLSRKSWDALVCMSSEGWGNVSFGIL